MSDQIGMFTWEVRSGSRYCCSVIRRATSRQAPAPARTSGVASGTTTANMARYGGRIRQLRRRANSATAAMLDEVPARQLCQRADDQVAGQDEEGVDAQPSRGRPPPHRRHVTPVAALAVEDQSQGVVADDRGDHDATGALEVRSARRLGHGGLRTLGTRGGRLPPSRAQPLRWPPIRTSGARCRATSTTAALPHALEPPAHPLSIAASTRVRGPCSLSWPSRDLGVIDGVTLLLDPGMTALTGETGAGKTMLVGAIGLLAGDRADAVGRAARCRRGHRPGALRGRRRRGRPHPGRAAHRPIPRLSRRSSDHGRRAHRAGGRPRRPPRPARPRGAAHHREPAPGPGSLRRGRPARPSRRRAAPGEPPSEELERLGGDAAARDRERDFLRFQLDEIEAAGLTDDGEDERLLAEESVLGDADAHREAADAADAALSTERGARDQRGDGAGRARRAGARSRPIVDRLRAVEAELADIAQELRAVGRAHRR